MILLMINKYAEKILKYEIEKRIFSTNIIITINGNELAN